MTDHASSDVTFAYDPADPAAINEAIARMDPELPRIAVQRVEVTDDGPGVLPEVLATVESSAPVLLVTDGNTKTRRGEDLNTLLVAALTDAGRDVEVQTVTGHGGGDPHATMEHIRAVAAAAGTHHLILTVGSGTITDIGKHAAQELDAQRDDGRRTPLAFYPTANSVCAYGAAMAPVTSEGVKRTLPSRLPDAIVLDVPTLVDAPLDMTLAGVGDVCAMFVSYGDWYLHCRFGGGEWVDAAWELATDVREQLFRHVEAMGRREPEAIAALGKILLLAGFSVSIPGISAPLSGYEHVTGHLLDLQAEYGDRETGLHGLQTGTATLPCAVAFTDFLDHFDPTVLDVDACYPDRGEREQLVRSTFDEVDPSGAAGRQCWDSYADKLDAWAAHREEFERFLADWDTERDRLRDLVTAPAEVARALRQAGVPTEWEELPTPIPDREAHWAFKNARLFRDRFSSADLIDLTGGWTDAFVDDVWARARAYGRGEAQ